MSLRYANGGVMKANAKNHLDAYYTKPTIAKELFNTTKKIIAQYENLDKYTWLEPSVGEGCFYDLLPESKIGIDINPTKEGVICANFLEWALPQKPLIVIGNPPFGHRGVLALEFIKHAKSAEFVAFILPMFFASLGKGSVRYRVQDLHLLHEQPLPKNSFYLANGKEKDISCVFQIWSKNHKNPKSEFNWYRHKKSEPFSHLLKVVTVSLAKNRECGKAWIFEKKANFYLSSTFFKQTAVVPEFSQVNYKSGVAIIYHENAPKDKLDKLFLNANWCQYSSLATNGCRHIGKSHIYQLLKDGGFSENDHA
ncbi:restriction endonuclease [Helicobacter heilmannii]|uniref:restriction endonuclease n=1 Tax=Helicobacter heilmannii TaxID=35817 RepID=UPI0006A21D03|nr:restriction endonuclease [Helicobacter heilmannii]CRF45072.1 putative TYPE II DNA MODIFICATION ENZYME (METHYLTRANSFERASE) [Helicobacter heilmannii]